MIVAIQIILISLNELKTVVPIEQKYQTILDICQKPLHVISVCFDIQNVRYFHCVMVNGYLRLKVANVLSHHSI